MDIRAKPNAILVHKTNDINDVPIELVKAAIEHKIPIIFTGSNMK